VEVARQNVVIAASQLKPQLGLGFGTATTRDKSQDQNYNSNSERLGMAWELDIWGRLRALRAAAEAGFEATALDYDRARQSLAATVSQAWYQAVELRRLVAVTEQALRTRGRLMRLSAPYAHFIFGLCRYGWNLLGAIRHQVFVLEQNVSPDKPRCIN
jgi:outer membrane protein, multidrug efflux system